jgi:hypothetical protein
VSCHRTVIVKVNADVDERVAPLVEALNSIDGVFTIDSCEDRGEGVGSVYFHAEPDPVVCARSLARELAAFAEIVRLELSFQIGDGGDVLELIAPTDLLSDVARAVEKAASPAGHTTL